MRRLFIAAALILFGCEAGLAQSGMAIPGIGITSPLGIAGATSPTLPTGIPLGATEINPGGVGPAPLGPTTQTANCLGTGGGSSYNGMIGSAYSGTLAPGAVSGSTTGGAVSGTTTDGESGTSGMTSSFDGGGMGSTTGCPLPSTGVVSSAGTASPMPGTTGTLRLDGGAIPLGSTEMNSAGISPLVGVPAPGSTITTTPCIGSMTTDGSSSLTSSMTSTSGC
jgi:hypothetical protein